jgi:peptidoglycan/LPS O-acetylase OafA/YrhL
MSLTPEVTPQRFHALDAVRGFALLLGIAGHVTMSFFPIPLWPIRDADPAAPLMTAFFVQHIFRMSLFFAIAGFFAHMLLHKRGFSGFVRDRLKRIALPLIVFWPLLFAAFIAVVVWSAIRTTGAPPPPPEGGGLSWSTLPLLHTWFLYMLLWLYAGMLGLVGLSRLIDGRGRITGVLDRGLELLAKTHLLPVALAAPLTATFLFQSSWVPFGGIRTPDVGLLPSLAAFVGFGTAFGFGWLLHRQADLLAVWRRWWPAYLVAAVGLTILVSRISSQAAPPTSFDAVPPADLLTAVAYPLAIWAWCLGLIGLALRVLDREIKIVRYLADSSYWLYLIHLPIVMAGQALVAQWQMNSYAKFALVLFGSTALMLATYQLLVRNTPIGGWLNGRRYGRRGKGSVAAEAVPAR